MKSCLSSNVTFGVFTCGAFGVEGTVLSLAVLTVVNLEDFDVVAGVVEAVVVLLQLDLEPQELLRKSLPALGSHKRGTLGGGEGFGADLLGEDVRVNTSVG